MQTKIPPTNRRPIGTSPFARVVFGAALFTATYAATASNVWATEPLCDGGSGSLSLSADSFTIGGYDARDRLVALKIAPSLPVAPGCRQAELQAAKPLLLPLKQSLLQLILEQYRSGGLFVDLDIRRRPTPGLGSEVFVEQLSLRIGPRVVSTRDLRRPLTPQLSKSEVQAELTAVEPKGAIVKGETIERNTRLIAKICLDRNPRRGGHARGSLHLEIVANTLGATSRVKVVVDAFSQPFISHCIEKMMLESNEISAAIPALSQTYVALFFRPEG